MTGKPSDEKCPRCRSTLLYDGNKYWCSHVGCSFGLTKAVGDLALGVMKARGAENAPVPKRSF